MGWRSFPGKGLQLFMCKKTLGLFGDFVKDHPDTIRCVLFHENIEFRIWKPLRHWRFWSCVKWIKRTHPSNAGKNISHGTLLQSWSHLEAASPRGNDVQSQGSALLKSDKKNMDKQKCHYRCSFTLVVESELVVEAGFVHVAHILILLLPPWNNNYRSWHITNHEISFLQNFYQNLRNLAKTQSKK